MSTVECKKQTEPSFRNIKEVVRHWSAKNPDKKAFIFLEDGEEKEISLTYSELDYKARIIGGLLQSMLKPEERVLIMYPSGLEIISAFFGCIYGANVVVPVYAPNNSEDYIPRIKKIIEDAGISVVLTSSNVIPKIAQVIKADSLLSKLKWVLTDKLDPSHADNWKEPHIESDSMAMLQYTSGSTSEPKGVIITHHNILYNNEMIKRYTEVEGSDPSNLVRFGWIPMAHVMGLIAGVVMAAYVGTTYVFTTPEMSLQKPIRWLRAISKYRAVTCSSPNFAYDLCSKVITEDQKKGLDLSCLVHALCGSEPIRSEMIDNFAEAFGQYGFKKEYLKPSYGLTEATVFVTGVSPGTVSTAINVRKDALENDSVAVEQQSSIHTIKSIGCGRPWLEEEVLIVNSSTLTQCPPDKVGEIWIKGPNVAKGYWKKQKETQETFLVYLADGRGPYLRTGDKGFFYDNCLHIVGRLKELIIIRGKNHYPKDIELTVQKSHKSLENSLGAAFSIDVGNEEQLVVVNEISANSLETLDTNEIITSIRRAVSDSHKIDTYAVILIKENTVPKTGSNKIQRSKCKEMLMSGKLETVADWRKDSGHST